MLPILMRTQLARWLLRQRTDAQDWCKRRICERQSSLDSTVSNGRAWLLRSSDNTSYTFLKEEPARFDLTTPFDEEIMRLLRSVSPATILEHSEDAELIKEAMDECLRNSGDLDAATPGRPILQEIADIAQIRPVRSCRGSPRARQAPGNVLAVRMVGEIDELRRSYKTDGRLFGWRTGSITSQTIEQHCGSVVTGPSLQNAWLV